MIFVLSDLENIAIMQELYFIKIPVILKFRVDNP